MGKETPLVSIGLSYYNNENTLELAVKSIIKQTYSNWELILFNDGSTDNSLEIAKTFGDSRIRVFSDNKNMGLTSRLNQIIRLSKGIYFARMDGDDIAYPQRLEKQVDFLEQHPEVDLVGAGMLIFRGDGLALGTRYSPILHKDICRRPYLGFRIAHVTFMGRLQWFKQHPYKESIASEDQYLLLRTYENSRFANLQEILLGCREEKLDMRKILNARRHYLVKQTMYFWANKRKMMAIKAAAMTLAKSIMDILAIGSGLDYRLLRHRAWPASPKEIDTWERVFDFVSED